MTVPARPTPLLRHRRRLAAAGQRTRHCHRDGGALMTGSASRCWWKAPPVSKTEQSAWRRPLDRSGRLRCYEGVD